MYTAAKCTRRRDILTGQILIIFPEINITVANLERLYLLVAPVYAKLHVEEERSTEMSGPGH